MIKTDKDQSSNTIQVIYNLWLALATLLILSLTTSLFLLLLEPLFTNEPTGSISQPSGLALILSLIAAIMFSYPLLMFLTKEYFHNTFKPLFRSTIGWGLVSIIIGVTIASVIHQVSNLYPPQPGQANTFDIIQSSGFLAQLLLIFATVVLAPFFEEYLFRGLIFDSLLKRFDRFVAICLSAVVFMAFHLIEYYDYWVGLLAILILGFFLAIIKQRSESILNPMICHASYNLTILMLV